MFRKRNVVCAVELGTSKICVLIAEVTPNGEPIVIGSGSIPSAGAVVKGEISDMERCCKLLCKALEDADRSSDGELPNCRLATVLTTGCGIDSMQGRGIVTITNADSIVTEADRAEANSNARRIVDLAPGREIINTSESYCTVDKRHVGNPLNQSGHCLEAYVHIIHGIHTRVDNFRAVLRDCGLENMRVEPVFSALAAGFGVVSDQEREHGSLMVDLGAGTTEYLVNANNGVCDSGVLQIGMEHVANDLSIGMNLHIDNCRSLLADGILAEAAASRREYIKMAAPGGREKKIPVAGCERIVEARLREIFEIVRKKMIDKKAPNALAVGGILTGGGAEYSRSKDFFCDVFELPCRIASPTDVLGSVTGITGPRYSAIWGALKSAAFFHSMFEPEDENVLQRLLNRFNRG